jgi:hypothetical protein
VVTLRLQHCNSNNETMPHGNNNRRPANAKKKGQRDRQAARAAANNSRAGTSAPALDWSFLQSVLNPENGDRQQPRARFDNSKDSIYLSYKKSTQRFKDALQSRVPPEIFASGSVGDLVDATDYVVKEDVEVDDSLVDDLKHSIRVRKRSALAHGGGDDGHLYFIEVLEYCWSFLAPRRNRNRAQMASEQDPCNQPVTNRYEHLSAEGGANDDSDNEDDLPQSPHSRPEPSSNMSRTLQELISGTDNDNILYFLFRLHELMRLNAWHFSNLKDAEGRAREQNLPTNTVAFEMMQASMVANLTIQQVVSLEQAFYHDHPHLNTVYRMLANLRMGQRIEVLIEIVAAQSPIASRFSEKHAVAFIGDAMECGFRSRMDASSKHNFLVTDFLECWQFQDDRNVEVTLSDGDAVTSCVSSIFRSVQALAKLEAPLKVDECDVDVKRLSENGYASHEWLPCDFIGTDRCITHTLRLLQFLSGFVTKLRSGEMGMRQGGLGTSWHDVKKPVTRSQIDMDDLLLSCIIPSLIDQCRDTAINAGIPNQDVLLTGLVQIKAFVDHPERPVSWALAFTVHTVLTSILELQESGTYNSLATTARSTFEKFFETIEGVDKDRQVASKPFPSIWDDGVQFLRCVKELLRVPKRKPQPCEQSLLSMWNPYCAGASLLYLSYMGNLCVGTMLLDSDGQLRVALHLFNALKQVNAVSPGDIPLLDWIHTVFEKCRVIWEGQLPIRGQLQTRWYTVLGLDVGALRRKRGSSKKLMWTKPRLWAEHFSTSYCEICLNDFQCALDTRDQRQRKRGGVLDKTSSRAN